MNDDIVVIIKEKSIICQSVSHENHRILKRQNKDTKTLSKYLCINIYAKKALLVGNRGDTQQQSLLPDLSLSRNSLNIN